MNEKRSPHKKGGYYVGYGVVLVFWYISFYFFILYIVKNIS
jgi:hypothetical protein